MSDKSNEPDFETMVKRRKAVEWLIQNDVFVRCAAECANRSPVSAILIGAQCGSIIESKIANAAPRMEVTREDRQGELSRIAEECRDILYHRASTHST